MATKESVDKKTNIISIHIKNGDVVDVAGIPLYGVGVVVMDVDTGQERFFDEKDNCQ